MDNKLKPEDKNAEKADRGKAANDIMSGALTGIALALAIVLAIKLVNRPDHKEDASLITENSRLAAVNAKDPETIEGERPRPLSPAPDQENVHPSPPRPAATAGIKGAVPEPGIKVVPGTYPDASTRILRKEELASRTNEELHLMRNEIFARHSYIFKIPAVSRYFEKQPWYRKKHSSVSAMLSKIEIENIKLIQEYERKEPPPRPLLISQKVRSSTLRFLPATPERQQSP